MFVDDFKIWKCTKNEKTLTKYLQSNKSLFDFVEFFCFTYNETYKIYALLRFIVIDMPKNEVRIYNSKAVIYQNDYDVWQFRMWLADEDKYIRQSLRTKDKAKAIGVVLKYLKAINNSTLLPTTSPLIYSPSDGWRNGIDVRKNSFLHWQIEFIRANVTYSRYF